MKKPHLLLWLCILLIGGAVAGCTPAEPTAAAATATVTAPAAATATAPAAATATSIAAPDPPTPTSGAAQATNAPAATSTTAPTPTAEADPVWQPDGVIGPDEYAHTTQAAGVTLHWVNDGEFLYAAVSAQTAGWVAVGLDPENRMQGANFIFGFVQGDQTSIADMYGTEPTAVHPLDEELGGTNDIVAYGGREEGGTTTVEFQIALDSGDVYDKPLSPGSTYPVLLAWGTVDEFQPYHGGRGASEITLD
jgi:hypothetical protein